MRAMDAIRTAARTWSRGRSTLLAAVTLLVLQPRAAPAGVVAADLRAGWGVARPRLLVRSARPACDPAGDPCRTGTCSRRDACGATVGAVRRCRGSGGPGHARTGHRSRAAPPCASTQPNRSGRPAAVARGTGRRLTRPGKREGAARILLLLLHGDPEDRAGDAVADEP